ncbi:MAG: hypothetical protein P1P65_04555 [Treponema sp.]
MPLLNTYTFQYRHGWRWFQAVTTFEALPQTRSQACTGMYSLDNTASIAIRRNF